MKAPSVIIGVGGIGSQICSKVEAQLNHAKRQKDGVHFDETTRFIAIDTDVNSLRELYRHGFRGTRILLTDNMTVAKCRDIIHDPSVDQWYPENTIFSRKSMTEGAGQQRSISRLAFEYCIRDGRLDQLDEVIRELNELSMNSSSQQTRFYVISSLAGGTGSGVILPLSMYLNRFIHSLHGDDMAICKGFFILSSAFYPSCESALERKSLDANAYAAVKELSAFMRNADDASAGPRLNYPLSSHVNYSGSTYEYCYLFGLTNVRAKGIHSFEELKSMVADAVYMQACSPMHDRNSSREDNTVRHTSMLGQTNQEAWRRRFGGIGCGRLLYPYEELTRYFGLRWARDTMAQDWRKYDEEYRAARKAEREQKRGKRRSILLDQGDSYINAVGRADSSDHLAAYIREECKDRDGAALWDLYLDAIEAEAQEEIDSLWEDYQNRGNSWDLFMNNLDQLTVSGKSREAKKRRYEAAERAGRQWSRIWDELEKRANILIATSAGRLFQLHPWDPEEEERTFPKFYLEHWLITQDGQFLHPNSVRYSNHS